MRVHLALCALLSTVQLAAAQVIVPGPAVPLSALCDDYKAFYPVTTVTDLGDGVATTTTSFPGWQYHGYADDSRVAMVIYDRVERGGTCWTASVSFLEGDPGAPIWNNPDTCYSTIECRDRLRGPAQLPGIQIPQPPLNPNVVDGSDPDPTPDYELFDYTTSVDESVADELIPTNGAEHVEQ